jgi:hypothetical protein
MIRADHVFGFLPALHRPWSQSVEGGVIMSRRFWLSLLAGICAGMVGTGCDPFHKQSVRSAENAADDTSDDSTSNSREARGFFKNNLSSGGWSSQARDIERELGAR